VGRAEERRWHADMVGSGVVWWVRRVMEERSV